MSGEIKIASRIKHVEYAIRDVVIAARKVQASGKKMHWMNIGDPNKSDFAPPPWVTDAVHEALNNSKYSGYAPSEGDPELREIIAKKEGIAAEKVYITSGLTEGLYFMLQALLEPGENVLLPSPNYPLYSTISKILGGVENTYDSDASWQPDLDDMRKKINAKTRAIVVISPNNPTGAVYSKSALKSIVELAGEHSIPIIADEIYDMMVFDGESTPLYKLAGDVPVIRGSGLSKNFLYPGSRVGYLALHGEGLENLSFALLKLCNARLSVNWEMQRGAVAAFTHPPDHIAPALAKLRKRRDLMAKRLNEINGIHSTVPQAAFYIFPQISAGPWKTDSEFVYDLLESTGIVSVPGSSFSPILPGKFFRLVYLAQEDEISEAMGKLEAFMNLRA